VLPVEYGLRAETFFKRCCAALHTTSAAGMAMPAEHLISAAARREWWPVRSGQPLLAWG